jgi:hypothetical protein
MAGLGQRGRDNGESLSSPAAIVLLGVIIVLNSRTREDGSGVLATLRWGTAYTAGMGLGQRGRDDGKSLSSPAAVMLLGIVILMLTLGIVVLAVAVIVLAAAVIILATAVIILAAVGVLTVAILTAGIVILATTVAASIIVVAVLIAVIVVLAPIAVLAAIAIAVIVKWYLPLISNSSGSCQHGDVIAARGFNDMRWPGK